MESVICIAVDVPTAALLREGHPEVAFTDESSPARLLARLRERKETVNVVVLGTGVEEPLRLSEELHALDPIPAVLILSEPARHLGLLREWRLSPVGSGEVRCRCITEEEALTAELAQAIVGAKLRRRNELVQRKAEEAATRSETRLRTLIHNEPECVKLVSPDGTLLEMNAAGLAMVDADSAQAVVGKKVFPLIAPEHREAFQNMHARVIQGHHESLEFETVGLRGTRRWLETCAVPVGDEAEGEVVHLAVTRDVTARKQAEQEILEHNQRLRLALEAAHMGTWNWDIRSDKITWSDEMETLLGVQRGELSDSREDYLRMLSPEDRAETERALTEALDGTRPSYSLEHRVLWPDGSLHWIECRGQVFRDEQGKPLRMAGISADISERKRMEEERSHLVDELRQAVKVRDEFLSIASHELRTPLTTLTLQVDGLIHLLSSTSGMSERLLSRARTLRRQADRLESLVSGLLDVSRVDPGQLQLQPENVDLARVAKDVVERLTPERGSPISLQVNGPVVGYWDPLRLDQVLTNLLSNALKYGQGKPIDVSVQASATEVILAVRDQGFGIAPADRARIFERFERAVSERHFGGLGLGLWIVRQIVDAVHGTIVCDSRPGAGSTFTVVLPRSA